MNRELYHDLANIITIAFNSFLKKNNPVTFALEINNLHKSYGATQAVCGVSFTIQEGEIFGLLGPNGAGKTSIISILSTLETATSGSAKVFGSEVRVQRNDTKRLIGVVPQEIVSHGFFNVEEVLRFHSGYYGLSDNETQIEFLLDRLGLKEHRKKRVRQLSGGMKRRLLIAKALVHKPKLLLLDEPTAGVDVELRSALWELVRELNQGGMSFLLTTHYLEEAENLCHRVGILHHGKLLRVSDTKTLVKQLTLREVTVFTTQEIAKVNSPYLSVQNKQFLQFRVPSEVLVGELIRDIPHDYLRDIKIREGTLEDAFLNLVEEKHT